MLNVLRKTKSKIIVLLFIIVLISSGIFFLIKGNVFADMVYQQIDGLEDLAWENECFTLKRFHWDPNRILPGGETGLVSAACDGDIATSTDSGIRSIKGDKLLNYRLNLKGTRLDPNSKYRISYNYRIADRPSYDVANPAGNSLKDDNSCPKITQGETDTNPNYDCLNIVRPNRSQDAAKKWHSVWSGYEGFFYKINSQDLNDKPGRWIKPPFMDYPGLGILRPDTVDWYRVESEFTTPNKTGLTIDMFYEMAGMIGEVNIDGLKLEKIDSFVNDLDLKTPVKMTDENNNLVFEITNISDSSVSTKAAKFDFVQGAGNGDDYIRGISQKTGQELGRISIPQINGAHLLQGLRRVDYNAQDDPSDVYDNQSNDPYGRARGVAVLESDYLTFFISADSVLFFKVKPDFATLDQALANIKVNNGTNPANPSAQYRYFQDGLLFTRNPNLANLSDPANNPIKYGEGYLFMPIMGDGDYRNIWDTDDRADTEIFSLRPFLTSWIDSGATVTYQAKTNDYFLFSLFPPKEFDMKKFCKISADKETGVLPAKKNVNTTAINQQSYSQFSNFNNIMVFFHGAYDWVKDVKFENPVDKSYFFPEGGHWRSNLDGPYEMSDPVEGRNLVEEAADSLRDKGVSSLFYMGPDFYRAQDTDIMLENLRQNLVAAPSFNGIYYDGYYFTSPVENLKLVRKTRALLEDLKSSNQQEYLFMMHQSGNGWFKRARDYEDSAFRLPFLDAYADLVWTGESQEMSTDTMFQNHFTGYGISNTVNQIMAAKRTSQGIIEGKYSGTVMSQVDQALKMLSLNGHYRVKPRNNPFDVTIAGDYTVNNTFNPAQYYQKLKEMCLPVVKDDNVCDMVENYQTSPEDCSPKNSSSLAGLYKENNKYFINYRESLANWLINGEPLFKLHYGFNHPNLLFDSSANKLDPMYDSKIYYYNDQEKAYEFGPAEGLSKPIISHHGHNNILPDDGSGRILDFNQKSFSVFSLIKNRSTDSDYHAIYTQGLYNQLTDKTYDRSDSEIYFGLNNNRILFRYKDLGVTSNKVIDGNWHMVGFTYDRQNRKITLYIDGEADINTLVFGDATDLLNLDNYVFSIGGQPACDNDAIDSTNDETEYLNCRVGYKYVAVDQFNGFIKDLFVTDTLLSPERINTFYAGGDLDKYLSTIDAAEPDVRAVLENQAAAKQYQSTANSVTITADKTSAKSGEIITYTLTLENFSGEVMTLSNLTNAIPSRTTFVPDSSTGKITKTDGSEININRSYSNNAITWIFDQSHPGALNPGDVFMGTYKVKVN